VQLQADAGVRTPWRMSLSLRRVGAVEVAAGEINALQNRVEIRHKSQISALKSQITEWYVNAPTGLEHGFTLAARPEGEKLRLVMTLDGDLKAEAAADGRSVALRNGDGGLALSYSGLKVFDATGRELEGRLTATGDELAIEVDDAGAVYPVVIDPTFFQPQKLTANDLEGFDFFGSSVALSGDTAIIGAAGNDANGNYGQGAAYVFTRSGSSWTLQQKLVSSDGAANDSFGRSVAIDGDSAIVGASTDDIDAAMDRGSAYVFTRTGTVWTEQQKLTASDGAAEDQFGVAVSIEGDTALVGAHRDDIGGAADRGSAYVFVRSGVSWSQQQKLTAADGAADDFFGFALSLSGESALIGAYSDTVGGTISQGSAYVFIRSGTAWAQQQKLTASDGEPASSFGSSVAINGDTAVIGCHGDDIGSHLGQGSAYVFTRVGVVWSQQQKLTSSDGQTADGFGDAVAVYGDAVLIGSISDDIGGDFTRGSAYVFRRTGASWAQHQKLLAPDGEASDAFGTAVALTGNGALIGASGVLTNKGAAYVFPGSNAFPQQAEVTPADGAADDFLGVSVAISGDTAIVGAPEDDIGVDADQGSVYVFVRSGAGWTQEQEINAADGEEGDLFGWSVSLSGDTALIGAFRDDIGATSNRGSAYVYTRSGSNWTQQAKLTASDGAAGDGFGFSTSVSGDTALVGAPYDDLSRGAAYVFTRSGTSWSQQERLTGSDGVASDQFGYAVSLSGTTALVGAPSDDVGPDVNQGSAYVFTRSGNHWSQQQKLTAGDGGPSDQFGQAVALNGDTALVGAPFDDIAGVSNRGSAYVFVRSGGDWSQQEKLTTPDGAAEDQFGNAVSLSGDTAIIGDHLSNLSPDGSGDQGAAHIFRREGSDWTRVQKLFGPNAAPGDEFGYSVAVSNDAAIVGAPYRQVGSDVNQGAAYLFNNCANLITINPAMLPAGQISAPYNQNLIGGGGFAPYTFSVIAGELPANMTISAAGVLSGAPIHSGVFNFTVRATDQNGCSGSRFYALTINPCPQITVNPAALRPGAAGVEYNQAMSASSGTAPYTFSVRAGALPPGLSLSPDGALLGKPAQSGVFDFTVRAVDANGCAGSRAYHMTVDCGSITINPARIANGVVGAPYSQGFTQTGGAGSIHWGVSAGALPPGLALNMATGLLAGVPSQVGRFNFTIRAADANTCQGARSYNLAVANVSPTPRAKKGDFDGDGRTDLAVWRPADGGWYIIRSSDNASVYQQWGLDGDIPTPGDYDNDGRTDYAVWRPADGNWYVIRSSDNAVAVQQWGLQGDIPTPGDYDNDGRTDFAIWRPSEGAWYLIRSSDQVIIVQAWGLPGDIPVPSDYDGDRQTDLAVWRPSNGTWYVIKSSDNSEITQAWGLEGDAPIPGDYDGDEKADFTVWRGTEGNWHCLTSAGGAHLITALGAGVHNDIPAPGDFDGDGKLDPTVWRPLEGAWYVIRSVDAGQIIQPWGLNGDLPVPSTGVR
jgi:hypothetical protein